MHKHIQPHICSQTQSHAFTLVCTHTHQQICKTDKNKKVATGMSKIASFGHPSQRDPGWRESNDPTYEAPTMTTQKLKHWLMGLGLGFQDPGRPLSPVGGKQLI